MTTAAYVPGLMDRSRFDRYEIHFVSDAAEVAALDAELVFVDLDKCEDPAAFRLDGVRVIGFGSHVEVSTLAQAQDLGFDEVLPRSIFFRTFPTLMGAS